MLWMSLALAAEPLVWDHDEGTQAVLVEDHRRPLVDMTLRFPAGTSHPWFAAAHLEEAWDNLLYDPDGELRARADALALDLSSFAGQRSSTLSMSCLKQDLPAALELVEDALANREFSKDELKRTAQGRDIGWESQQKDPNFILQQAAVQLFFGAGDWRIASWEEPADVEKTGIGAEIDVLLALPGRLAGFAGDLTQDEAKAALDQVLPALGEERSAVLPMVAPDGEPAAEVVVPMANLTQVYLSLVREGLTWQDENYAAWKVANHVLAGHFYSRLYVALRHEGGETYGVGSWFNPANDPRHYGLWTFTRSDNVDVTVEKLRGTLVAFGEEGMTEDELGQAKGYYRGREAFDNQSPGQTLSTALWELGNGLPLGFDDQVVDDVEALELDAVNAFVSDYYVADAFTLVKVVPE